MPIIPQPTHVSGDYPDTIRHVSNGDPGNQTFFRNPSIDLQFRTDVLKDFSNTLESTVNTNFNTLDAFDKNHDHSGSNGEKVLNFARSIPTAIQPWLPLTWQLMASFPSPRMVGAQIF